MFSGAQQSPRFPQWIARWNVQLEDVLSIDDLFMCRESSHLVGYDALNFTTLRALPYWSEIVCLASSLTLLRSSSHERFIASDAERYVFTRIGGVWSQQAYLKASNAGAGQNFGGALTFVGDVVAIASRLEDSNATGIDGD